MPMPAASEAGGPPPDTPEQPYASAPLWGGGVGLRQTLQSSSAEGHRQQTFLREAEPGQRGGAPPPGKTERLNTLANTSRCSGGRNVRGTGRECERRGRTPEWAATEGGRGGQEEPIVTSAAGVPSNTS